MRIALLAVAGIALIAFLAVAVVLPGMEGAEAKNAAQQLVDGAQAAKQQVAAIAEKAGTLSGSGKGVKISARADSKLGDMEWIVSDDGAIRAWNKQNALEITLTPALQGGKANWSCKGYPISAMPADCGGHS